MKTRFTNIVCGLTTASIFALALTGCDDNSLIAPTGGYVNSSVIENRDASSSSNGVVPPESSNGAPESSNGTPSSSETPASSANEPASSGNDVSSSSTIIEVSSSSKIASSSSSTNIKVSSSSKIASSSSITFEKCIDMEQMCPPCVKIDGEPACQLTNEACNACTTEGATAPNCKGGLGYVCSDGLWKQIKGDSICDPGDDCDGDGIPDGIYRPDLEPCNTEESTLKFYNRYFVCNDGAWNRIDKQACDENGSTKVVGNFGFQCVSGKWEYLPPPISYINENATDVSAMNRGGPAVTPRVVKVQSASGSVTFRDDGVLIDDLCIFDGLNAELRGDTLFANILYPGCKTTGGHMGVITFTLGIDFADVKYIKYEGKNKAQPVYEADELLPCGNTSSCNTCGGDTDDLRVGC